MICDICNKPIEERPVREFNPKTQKDYHYHPSCYYAKIGG